MAYEMNLFISLQQNSGVIKLAMVACSLGAGHYSFLNSNGIKCSRLSMSIKLKASGHTFENTVFKFSCLSRNIVPEIQR